MGVDSHRIGVLHFGGESDWLTSAVDTQEGCGASIEILPVNSVTVASQHLDDQNVDCVLASHDPPEVDARELLQAVRNRDGEMPFVALTEEDSPLFSEQSVVEAVSEFFPEAAARHHTAALVRRINTAVEGYRAGRRRERMERVNRLLRRLNRRLVDARTRPEIERVVCETLTESDQYRFAWIGRPDPESNRIEYSTAAGDAESYLDAVEIRCDDSPLDEGPAGRAARSCEPQVAQEIATDERFEPWRAWAREYGFESAIALPVCFEEELDSVLAVYADQSNAFSEAERTALSELSDTIGESLAASETRHRLTAHEQELRRTDSLLATLFDALPVGIIAEDEDRRVIMANDQFCEMFDVSQDPGDIVGCDCRRLAAEAADAFEAPEAFTDRIDECVADRSAVHCEELALADGRAFAQTYLPIDLPGAEGNLWVYWDVTDRRERERRLKRQNERLDTFTSVVSHDLRNPLNVAVGHLELAREECDSDHLDRVESAHDRIQQLIDDLLTVAREGVDARETEPIAVNDVFEACCKTVETADATIQIETDLTVVADHGRLKQLLENLIRNAVEYGGEDVTLTVGNHEDGFYVADDGPGIPPEERQDIFDAGYSSRESGTGFGLSIVRRIAEAHGWSVAVTDSAAGGARFEFSGVETVETE